MRGAIVIFSAFFILARLAAAPAAPAQGKIDWKLRFTEEFNGTKLNTKLWSRIDRGNPDWCKNMSTREDLVTVSGGQLHCHGKKNDDLAADPRRCLTGGVRTKGKFAMKYGKVELKVKLEGQKGAWPAVWMMPEYQKEPWPREGEIDIIERLNYDSFVYQTVHSDWTQAHPGDPPRGGRGNIDPDGWNIYAIEWTADSIRWFVNGVETHSYRKIGDDPIRYPWTSPFFLMIDMQLGGRWVGAIDESTLPVAMHVDWVKFYEGRRGREKIGSFERPKPMK